MQTTVKENVINLEEAKCINFYKEQTNISIEKNQRKRKVSFVEEVEIHEIPNNNITKRERKKLQRKNEKSKMAENSPATKYAVINLNIKIAKKYKIHKLAKLHSARVFENRHVILNYKNREDLEKDLFNMGLKKKIDGMYMVIVYNLHYKETEESVEEYFKQFNEVSKVTVEKNSKGFCTGKAMLMMRNFDFTRRYKKENRKLRIEKAKGLF